jgi:hypothetical protein
MGGGAAFYHFEGPLMTTLIDRPVNRRVADIAPESADPAGRLRATMAACRVQFRWFGTQKSLTAEQKAQAADSFDAEGPYLSATKKLVDTKHSAFRAVTAIRTAIVETWRSRSLPFPEPGIRLLRLDDVDAFDRRMADYKSDLDDAVDNLDRHFGELRQAAAGRLGSLFNPDDYPSSLVGLFGVAWDYPNCEPPVHLIGLAPGLYEQERARVRARFEQAVELAERAFLDEFNRTVAHLCERLDGSDADGTPKVFRDTAVDNLSEFFERFRSLNVHSSRELDDLVEQARRAVRGVSAQELRDGAGLRSSVAGRLGEVRSSLDALMVERPRRRILRGAVTTSGGA